MADFCRNQGFFIFEEFCPFSLRERISFGFTSVSRIRSKCTPKYSAKLYSRDNVAHIIAHLVHPLHPLVHGVFLNTISQYFTGLYVPRNGLYHALGVALKASQRWETHKLCRGGCESLSSLLSLLLILASSLPRLHSPGCVRLTNEGNKLCRRPATSCIMKRDLFRARATTNEELQGGTFSFPSFVSESRGAKYDRGELNVNCWTFVISRLCVLPERISPER